METYLEDRVKLGEAIAIVRGAKGWTQDQLSKASGISRMSISRIELGDRVPRRRTVYRLARALNVAPELLSNPRVSETELLEAVRRTGSGRQRGSSSRAPKTLLPTRSLPVLKQKDLEGIPFAGGAGRVSERQLPARTDDPAAFYLVAEGPELTWELRCPEGSELLLEPSIPPAGGDLVVVRSAEGLALRRLVMNEGQRELRSLTPAQATIVWSPGLELARVARVVVDPSLWT